MRSTHISFRISRIIYAKINKLLSNDRSVGRSVASTRSTGRGWTEGVRRGRIGGKREGLLSAIEMFGTVFSGRYHLLGYIRGETAVPPATREEVVPRCVSFIDLQSQISSFPIKISRSILHQAAATSIPYYASFYSFQIKSSIR